MIAWLISSKLGRALAAAGAVLIAILTFGASQRRKGAQDAVQRQAEEDAERRKEADAAANNLRGADRNDLNDQLRANDSHW